MTADVAIVGIGMHAFGRHPGVSSRAQATHAIKEALSDASLTWSDMQFAVGGSRDGGDADTLVSDLGLTGLPFANVWNGCATGGSALQSAHSAIASGSADVGIVVGFDKHDSGAFSVDPESMGLPAWYGETGLMLTTQFFGLKVQRYLHEQGLDPSILQTIAAKAFRNGSLNPNAWRRKALSEREIADSAMVSHPLTQYMFCSPGEGAVALVLSRADRARSQTNRPVYLNSISMRSRRFGSFEVFSPWLSPERGDSPTVDAAAAAFELAGIAPQDIDVAQVQDTEAGAELMHMAETGLCKHGEQEGLIRSGATEIGGAMPVNTDGGCLANGEPIGASGLRQVHEVALQLRGEAGERQIPGPRRVGFTQVYGAPGVSACTVLSV
jgi:acetyl-CoA acetyltransferase